MKIPFRTLAGLLVCSVLAGTLFLGSCQSSLPNQNPEGLPFPQVSGESLAGEQVSLPPAGPSVLLVGYKQKAQFDADHWLLGILQAGLDVPIFEVPTLKGLFPRVIGNYIDKGMRSGIPSEDREVVVTLYGDNADQVARFTGTEGRNMRVLLLDDQGQAIWFHDEGYSARAMLDLKAKAASL